MFSELGLAEPILRSVSDEGYENPTPIQAKVIPILREGRDLVGIAQTGTGKTASFVLPILDHLARNHLPLEPRHCRALIIAPTRELAAQITQSVRTYGRHVRLKTATIVGGVKPGPQIKALSRGVDVLVGTPGRLLDHLGTGALKLGATSIVILDEGDQMLDLGFMPAIRRLMTALPRKRQTALLSATMPKAIRALADEFLHEPAEIAVAPQSRPIERIKQRVELVDASLKSTKLVEILKTDMPFRTIVFTRTKYGADKLSKHLDRSGLTASAIHGNKSQGQRERALAAFKAGRTAILVATDIAARGLDIDGVDLVVNYELPNVPESYVHRIGRTARAGESGAAVALCDAAERPLLRSIERLIGQRIDGSPPAEPRSSRKPGRKGAGAGRGFGGSPKPMVNKDQPKRQRPGPGRRKSRQARRDGPRAAAA